MTVPFPNGALEVFAEAAFGADIAGDQSAWVWTDLTPAQMDQTITTTRGRQDEASDVAPTQSGLELDNPAGALTPFNAMSPYYPHVDLGTPGRWGIKTTTPRLLLSPSLGARAQVNSTAALNITSDLDVRVDLHAKTIHPDAGSTVIAGRADDVGPYSWRLEFLPDRRVTLLWSDDGTPTAPIFETSTVPVMPSSARAILRATLDVDNGGGGYDVKFYLGQSITGPWMQVGPTMTGPAPTTVFNAAADLVVGDPPSLTAVEALDADIYRFQLRNGIDGPVIADADFTAQPSGTFSFVDSAGRTWNLFNAAEISNKWCRIVGTIDEWAPKWPWGDLSSQQDGGLDEGQARVDITINGILRRLGQGALPLQSALRRSIDDEPTRRAYWPAEDEKDSTQIASAVPGGSPIVVGGGITYADNDELVGSKPLPKMGPTTFFSGPVSGVFTGDWQVDWYAKILFDPLTTGTWSIRRITSTGTVRSWEVRVTQTSIAVFGFNSAGGVVTTTTSTNVTNFYNRMLHIRLWARQNGTNVDWTFAWAPVTYPASPIVTFTGSYAGAVGQPTTVGFTPGTGVDGLVQGHIAVFAASALDTTAGAAMGWMGETALERIDRLCHEERVSLRVIGSSAETALMGPQQVATLLDLLDVAADADGGILYEQQCSVGLIYRTRASLYNQPDNLVLDGIGHQIANPFAPIRDDQKIHNVITVQREGGSSSTVVDQASVDKHGAYTESVTLNLLLDSQTVDAAGWRLHQGTVEAMRYASVSTNLGDAPEVISPWLTVDVGAKIHVTGLPPQHPTNAVHLMIDGYSEPISPTTWEPKANCSPGSVWDVTELDGDWVSDEYLLRLETDGSIVAAQATPSATSLFVEVTAGPRWVTTASEPGELPFDADVAGERVTVTAIGAPTGGAQFTGGGDFNDSATSTSFIAPSVSAVASGDLLIAAWCSTSTPGTYTVPGGMTAAALTTGFTSAMEDARQVLGASGPTGTRTATFSASDTWSAVSIAVHGAATPTIVDYLSAVSSPGDVVFGVTAEVGDWLLVIQAWDFDAGANMSAPSGDGWIPIASSSVGATITASRIRVWAKRILADGVYTTTLGVTPLGVNDNHGRLYLLRGVTGITQTFTVVRSVNGVVKSQGVGNPVTLWFTPVLAR